MFFVDGALRSIDPAVAGISVLRDFGFRPYWTAAAGGNLFFVIDDGVHGDELWKSDGTSEGTSLVADLEPGPADSASGLLTAHGELLYFFRSDPEGNVSLWSSDGTEQGTVRVKAFEPGVYAASQERAASVGSLVFFVTLGGTDDALPFRLWRSDGTDAGTFPLRGFAAEYDSVCPGSCLPYGPTDLTALGSLLFLATDGVSGRELWRSDGTPAGTVLVKDVLPGPGSGVYFGLVRAGNLAYFTGQDRARGWELWRTDGTTVGTALVKDIEPGENSSDAIPVAALEDRVLFLTGESASDLRISDGTADGTILLTTGGLGGWPYGFVPLAGSLLFLTWVGNGSVLWRTDGTEAGTRRVEGFAAGAGSYPYSLSPAGGWLAFFLQDRAVIDPDAELWGSDGSEAGTTRLATFRTAVSGFVTNTSASLGRAFCFAADDGTHGTELWRSDGTAEGTAMVEDILPGPGESFPHGMALVGDRLYFAAWNGDRQALWSTDGTAGGTAEVSDAVSPSGEGEQLAALGNLLIFTGRDEANGAELWRSDGTRQGTVLVKDINPGPNWSSISRYVELAGRLYFVAYDGSSNGLWRTDGTAAGTVRVREFDIPFGYDLAASGSLIYFMSDNATELWVSDGTEAGTRKIKDVPGRLESDGGRRCVVLPRGRRHSRIGALDIRRDPRRHRDGARHP